MRNMPVPVVPVTTSETEPVATLPAEEAQPEAQLDADSSMWAIVLAGGIGSRFWPLSTPERPKQLLKLIGERPLIAETGGPTCAAHSARARARADEPRHRAGDPRRDP
jgi:hypothetical protein